MRSLRPWLYVLLLLLLIGVAVYLHGITLGTAATGVNVGERPPNFRLPDVQGRMVELASFRGKPIVLNFFASWCGPCKAETPLLVHYAKLYRGKIVFLGVDLLASEPDRTAIDRFVAAYHIPYPVLLDATGQVAVTYMVASIPVTYVINQQGVIQAVYRQRLDSSFGAVLKGLAGSA